MRVIAGTARSMPLKAPAGMDTRPTQDRIKETLFNILQTEIPGCIFVDLFAGSGGIGIEALSRGASRAYFVDNGAKPASCIAENLTFTKLSERGTVLRMDALSGLQRILQKEDRLDIVFLDPPYGQDLELPVLELLGRSPGCDADTRIILETDLGRDYSGITACGLTVERVKSYKTNQHVFFRKNAHQAGENS
ncbi:MAG: 16S rRNA (guanine(966)-N(2))-methyltransferase RsmD [Lachnospiraceae bacterium]|nr:16S rRNA (guanine(966)-N(2))-methyltransferase RsmD [Lachnospiraceae bacterium]